MTEDRRKQLFSMWYALRHACQRQHKGGPGGAAVCVCGAAGGRSEACAMLSTLRDLIRYTPTDGLPAAHREMFEALQSIV